jgi:hypothetical protein
MVFNIQIFLKQSEVGREVSTAPSGPLFHLINPDLVQYVRVRRVLYGNKSAITLMNTVLSLLTTFALSIQLNPTPRKKVILSSMHTNHSRNKLYF